MRRSPKNTRGLVSCDSVLVDGKFCTPATLVFVCGELWKPA